MKVKEPYFRYTIESYVASAPPAIASLTWYVTPVVMEYVDVVSRVLMPSISAATA